MLIAHIQLCQMPDGQVHDKLDGSRRSRQVAGVIQTSFNTKAHMQSIVNW